MVEDDDHLSFEPRGGRVGAYGHYKIVGLGPSLFHNPVTTRLQQPIINLKKYSVGGIFKFLRSQGRNAVLLHGRFRGPASASRMAREEPAFRVLEFWFRY